MVRCKQVTKTPHQQTKDCLFKQIIIGVPPLITIVLSIIFYSIRASLQELALNISVEYLSEIWISIVFLFAVIGVNALVEYFDVWKLVSTDSFQKREFLTHKVVLSIALFICIAVCLGGFLSSLWLHFNIISESDLTLEIALRLMPKGIMTIFAGFILGYVFRYYTFFLKSKLKCCLIK